MEGTTSGRITSNTPFSHDLPKVGDIVQQVKGGGYTGYVREVNLENEYVKTKWYKGTDNVFEDYQFFKYGPWNGTDSAIKVITNPVPREWWPTGNEWLFINLDIWRDHHHLTELDMIEAVHESGGPLAFAIEKDIYQIHRWTPPTHAEYVAGAENPDIPRNIEPISDMEIDIDVEDAVAIDINGHTFNGIVSKTEYVEGKGQLQVTVFWEDITIWADKNDLVSITTTIHPGDKVRYKNNPDNEYGIVLRTEDNTDHNITLVLVYFETVDITHDLDELTYLGGE